MSPNGVRILPVRNPYTAAVDYEITAPAPDELAILRFLRKKALLTQAAPPAALVRPGPGVPR
jgi:hypothetical protein